MKVFIAVDNSERSEKAFDWYLKNLYKEEHEVCVCHEADHPQMPVGMFADSVATPQVELEKIASEHRKRCDHLKHHYVKKCEDAKLTRYEVLVDTTKSGVGHGIVKMAESVSADLIVVGSRGSGVLRRTVLGSVSDYVMHHTKISVFIYHYSSHGHHHHGPHHGYGHLH